MVDSKDGSGGSKLAGAGDAIDGLEVRSFELRVNSSNSSNSSVVAIEGLQLSYVHRCNDGVGASVGYSASEIGCPHSSPFTFEVRASNDIGTSAWSEPVTLWTQPPRPPQKPFPPAGAMLAVEQSPSQADTCGAEAKAEYGGGGAASGLDLLSAALASAPALPTC